MHYNFLFVGGSWVEGGELEGINHNHEYRRTHAFPHLISEHFNKTYDVVAHGGITNHWIAEKTVEWFDKGNTCDFVIIQFGPQNRSTWYDELFLDEYNLFNYMNYKNKSIERSAKFYYEEFYTNHLGVYNFYKNLFAIELFLSNKNIKKYFCITISEENYLLLSHKNYAKFRKTKRLVNLIDLVGYENNFRKEKNLNPYYCKDLMNKDFPRLNGLHPNEMGHQLIADFIIKEIKDAL